MCRSHLYLVPFTSANGYSRHITLPSTLESFFGRLKNEFFYYRDWSNVTVPRFIDELDRYMHYYLEEREKESLGWLSPMDYRKSLGLVA